MRTRKKGTMLSLVVQFIRKQGKITTKDFGKNGWYTGYFLHVPWSNIALTMIEMSHCVIMAHGSSIGHSAPESILSMNFKVRKQRYFMFPMIDAALSHERIVPKEVWERLNKVA